MTAPTKTSVVTANGESNSVTGVGSITLTPTISLHKTLLVPTLAHNLLSVGQRHTLYETTCRQTPKPNGVAEHKNRHILETA
ncbi:hypothetical protein CerSpe_066000 [Prunus speciosa]